MDDSSSQPRERRHKASHDPPKVSIVIATRNSARTLSNCLATVRAQTYKNIEVIVVDNHSWDATVEVAREMADQVRVAGPERSTQVNIGARIASGDYVYRVGSDFILDVGLVEEAVLAAEADDLDGIVVHNDSDPSVGFWARIRHFERAMYRDDFLNVAARFIRRDVFLEIGGMDEELVAGEDYDLHARLLAHGCRIGRIQAGETHVEEPISVWEIVRKYFYYGRHLRRYVHRHGRRSLYQLSPLRPAYVRNWWQFLRHPLLAGGFLFYLGVKYASGVAGFLTPGRSFGKRSSMVRRGRSDANAPQARRRDLPK